MVPQHTVKVRLGLPDFYWKGVKKLNSHEIETMSGKL